MLMNIAFREFSINHISTKLIQAIPKLRENGGKDLYIALLIMKMFESSCPDLQSELGDCYYQGDGVQKNVEKALDMFQKAAEKGSIRAQYDLGWYYYDCGEYFRSIDNFTFCISHDKEMNENNLGNCYACLGDAYSKISEPKISIAIEKLAIAADKYHHGFACRRLGMIYSQLETNYFDPDKAVKYFAAGASYGDLACAHELAVNYIFGNESLMIKPNGQKAENILLPLADSGDPDILCDLGLLYRRGDLDNNIEINYPRSKMYFEYSWKLYENPFLAANLGYVYFCLEEYRNAESMLTIADQAGYSSFSDFLGRIYKEGYLGSVDLNKAIFYYGRAYDADELNNIFTYVEYAELLIKAGNYQKAYEIADKGEAKFNDICFVFIKSKLVLNGQVINKMSLEQAAKMMEACLNYDMPKDEGYMILGKYYYSVHEFRKAEKQYMNAFDLGVADAAVLLGKLYEDGGGTIHADINKAVEWYSKAAEAGSLRGREEISCFKKGIFGGYRRIRSLS